MARKKKHPEHVNHERWLISYADFITLLFAFFVVMFAVSQVDTKKVGRFTESFSRAVGVDIFPSSGKGLLPGQGMIPIPLEGSQGSEGDGTTPPELESVREALVRKKSADSKLSTMDVRLNGHELVLRLPDGIVFDSGDDAVRPDAARVLGIIVDEIRARPVDLRVEGHTDTRPIGSSRFRSNWDLSTSRATSVVRMLAAKGLTPDRLSAAGYAEFHPVATNDTVEGRTANRRVDIVLRLRAGGAPRVGDANVDAGVDAGVDSGVDSGVEAGASDLGGHR